MDHAGAGPVVSAPVHGPLSSDSLKPRYLGPDDTLGLPAGFPTTLEHKRAWTGAHFKDDSEYVHQLTDVNIAEIKRALSSFKALELDGDLISHENFPLPTLGRKLAKIGHCLYNGLGFHVIRGINPNNFSREDLVMVWLGIQAHIADQQGRQDHKGNMLVHIVADDTTVDKVGHHRHSTSAITFHNEEAGDITSWLTKSTAASGGRCIIASAYTIYNVLATHRPDVIRTLAKADWPFAFPRFQCRPVIFYQDSKLIMNFGRTPLLGNDTHPRPDHLPKTTDQQREALDLVEAIAVATQLEIKTQPGDIHLINNLAVLHRREGFVDGKSEHDKRHLIRMRLRSTHLGWDIPADLSLEWDHAFAKDAVKTWHLEPMPGDAFPLRKYTN